MMCLCSNHSSRAFVAAAKEYPGRLGWLMGPTHFKYPKPAIPFALDNDAFIHWSNSGSFNHVKWVQMLNTVKRSGLVPMWVLVPDAVANRELTLKRWRQYYPVARSYGWPLAFAVQDGMSKADVPQEADIVFVGGSTQWKWNMIGYWCECFPRVHVGRVNGIKGLWICQDHGAESCDGSGFLREGFTGKRANGLKAWLRLKTNPQPTLQLFHD